jgi:hypothetical protein
MSPLPPEIICSTQLRLRHFGQFLMGGSTMRWNSLNRCPHFWHWYS